MQITEFNEGLSTRLAPHFLSKGQGVEFTNIDITTGELKPVKDKVATAVSTFLYNAYYVKGDEWVGSNTPTTYLNYQNVLYSADGVQPTKRRDGVTHNLGIVAPTEAPTITLLDAAEPIATFDVTNDGTQGDLSNGELAYRIYNVKNDTMSTATEVLLNAVADNQYDSTTVSAAYPIGIVQQVAAPAITTVTSAATGPRAVAFSNIVTEIADEARLYRYYNGTWRLLHSFTSQTALYTDTVDDISANDEIDSAELSGFTGTYQYLTSFYNVDDGTESAPSALTDELDIDSGAVQLTFTDTTSDPQVTHRRIYRVGGDRTLFALVEEIDVGTTTYLDNLTDSEMDGRLLESENYYQAPEGLQFISESYAMLFGAVDYTLYFTPVGVPNAWPPEYSIQFNAPITGIGPVANGVLVMTQTQTFIVTGTGPLSLALQTLRGDQGCISHFSIQEVQNGAIVWASEDGLCASSGNDVTNITKSMIGEVKFDVVNSAVVDEVYYLHLTDGSTFVWDYRFSTIFRKLELGVDSVTAAKSAMWGWKDGVLYALFSSDTVLPLTYLSPRFADGSLTDVKTYKKVYVGHEGDIIIDIIINDSVVATRELTGSDTTMLQAPSSLQRGRYIQFRLTGTGTVTEIKYTSEGQKNV